MRPRAGATTSAPLRAAIVSPRLVWLFLDWPRIRVRIAQADASADAALARYEQIVLLALEDTERALTRYGRDRERFVQLQPAETQSREAARISSLRFRNGIDNFLNVIDAERVKLKSEDRAVVSRIETARQFIAIYKAIGGGWE